MLDLAVNPTRLGYSNKIVFLGRAYNQDYWQTRVPKPDVKTPKKEKPVELPDVSFFMATGIIQNANKAGLSVDQYLRMYLKPLTYVPKVTPEKSRSAKIGDTKVTTLIDGEQIFDKTINYIKNAEKSIQVEMFEFQNLRIDAHKWPTNGSEVVPGFEQQQSILPMLISKKKENPDLKIQIILDAHKWYMNGHGERDRHYNNQDMIKYLKKNGIDVVPYPRASQQGASLQHVKILAVDGKKLIIGGMNWGTHSPANHDACVAIETLPNKKASEVDNIIENIFNKDWAFAWQRLGKTKFVIGPLNEQEQDNYNGLNKEIKQENIDYMRAVGELFNNPEDKLRYEENRLDIIPTNPIENPKIEILASKPKELELTGQNGEETVHNYVKNKLETSQKIIAELFVLSHKEFIETVIKRSKNKELDARFIVSSEILEEFPFCRKAYNELKANNIPVRVYDSNEKINQRMHNKWAIFDDKDVLIGSANWSGMAMDQNLKKGKREDYKLHSAKIDEEIKGYVKEVAEFEDKLGIPSLSEFINYEDLKNRRKQLKKANALIDKNGEVSIEIQNKQYLFTKVDKSDLSTILGYYEIINKRNNAKERYKRGNNECAVAFENTTLAKVFSRQFEKDWKVSVSEMEKLRGKIIQFPTFEGEKSEKKLDLMG